MKETLLVLFVVLSPFLCFRGLRLMLSHAVRHQLPDLMSEIGQTIYDYGVWRFVTKLALSVVALVLICIAMCVLFGL